MASSVARSTVTFPLASTGFPASAASRSAITGSICAAIPASATGEVPVAGAPDAVPVATPDVPVGVAAGEVPEADTGVAGAGIGVDFGAVPDTTEPEAVVDGAAEDAAADCEAAAVEDGGDAAPALDALGDAAAPD